MEGFFFLFLSSIIQDLLKAVKYMGTFMIEYRTFLRDERLEKHNPMDYNVDVISWLP